MTTPHRLGIILNGVTGRMGTNQHLIRSILAIMQQGGVKVSDDLTLMPDPILTGRNEDKLRALAQKHAAELIDGFELATPIVLVCLDDEANLAKSFRNLDRVAVVQPAELEVAAVVWARSLLVSEAALPVVEARAK